MKQPKVISANTEEEIWQQVEHDFIEVNAPLDYNVIIDYNNKQILLDIDIDPGGGFESGYTTTIFSSRLNNDPLCKLSIHKKDFADDIGKLFGMEDVVIGYPKFDDRFIIKTNNPAKVKEIFSDAEVQEVFSELKDCTLNINEHLSEDKTPAKYLQLEIEEGITDIDQLKKIYHAFLVVLNKTDS